ncbi:MAG: hypothetical protein E6R03_11435 [Hyphomicrobiaceae bacterium]|nr:MAG: hypothetical protein E6R03_11435 [Hyphomicrobiaceae bacterium]
MPIFVSHVGKLPGLGAAVANDISTFQRDRVLNNEAQQQASFQAQLAQQALQNAMQQRQYEDQLGAQQYARDVDGRNFDFQQQQWAAQQERQQQMDLYNQAIDQRNFNVNQQQYADEMMRQQMADAQRAQYQWAQLGQRDASADGNLAARYAAIDAANQRAAWNNQADLERAQGNWGNQQALQGMRGGQAMERAQYTQGQQNYRAQGGWQNQQQMQDQRFGFQGEQNAMNRQGRLDLAGMQNQFRSEQNALDRAIAQERLALQRLQQDAAAGRVNQAQARAAYDAWTQRQTQLLTSSLSSLTSQLNTLQQARSRAMPKDQAALDSQIAAVKQRYDQVYAELQSMQQSLRQAGPGPTPAPQQTALSYDVADQTTPSLVQHADGSLWQYTGAYDPTSYEPIYERVK